MKILFFTYTILFLCSCTEVPPILPTDNNSTGSKEKNVLIEEYTGVRCQNCPSGAQQLEALKQIHGDRLTILSIHGGFFAQPTNRENKYNLDNADGVALINLFNQPVGYPSAMVDRKIFDGQSSIFSGANNWAGYIISEKSKEAAVSMDLLINKNTTTRQVSGQCIVKGLTDLGNQSYYLSVALAENNIKDAQLTLTGVDTNYIHRHVMRKFITGINGKKLDSITLNSNQSYSFTITIDPLWNLEQIYLVAFVHKNAPDYEVIQVVEKN